MSVEEVEVEVEPCTWPKGLCQFADSMTKMRDDNARLRALIKGACGMQPRCPWCSYRSGHHSACLAFYVDGRVR